jgi:hypothetical protein
MELEASPFAGPPIQVSLMSLPKAGADADAGDMTKSVITDTP